MTIEAKCESCGTTYYGSSESDVSTWTGNHLEAHAQTSSVPGPIVIVGIAIAVETIGQSVGATFSGIEASLGTTPSGQPKVSIKKVA